MNAILIFRSAALGDFILAVPALGQVREIFPNKKIVLLTSQSIHKEQRLKVANYAGNTNRIPWVDMAVPHLIDQSYVIDNIFDFYSLWSLRKELKIFAIEKVILMIDPCSPWLSRIKKLFLIYFLIGLIPTFGWKAPGSINGNRAKLKQKKLLKHHVYGSLQFLSEMDPPLTFKDEDLKFDLRPEPEAENWVTSWIRSNNLGQTRLVSVAPGSIHPHKRWPISLFSEMISKLLAQYLDITVLIIGTPGDKSIGDTLVALSPKRIFNLAGVTSIAQSAALLKKCTLLVGNDGGAIHLGDAMGCKVVSIIPGIEYPDSIEPWHNKDLVVRHPVPCAPCYCFTHCPQKHNKCMTELPVYLVSEKCEQVLNNN